MMLHAANRIHAGAVGNEILQRIFLIYRLQHAKVPDQVLAGTSGIFEFNLLFDELIRGAISIPLLS